MKGRVDGDRPGSGASPGPGVGPGRGVALGPGSNPSRCYCELLQFPPVARNCHNIRAFSGERTNIVYYDDARISDRYRLGGVNDGWAVLHGPLDEEHSVGDGEDGLADLSIGRHFLRPLEAALDTAIDWARI